MDLVVVAVVGSVVGAVVDPVVERAVDPVFDAVAVFAPPRRLNVGLPVADEEDDFVKVLLLAVVPDFFNLVP